MLFSQVKEMEGRQELGAVKAHFFTHHHYAELAGKRGKYEYEAVRSFTTMERLHACMQVCVVLREAICCACLLRGKMT
jgi:hypothetical protein